MKTPTSLTDLKDLISQQGDLLPTLFEGWTLEYQDTSIGMVYSTESWFLQRNKSKVTYKTPELLKNLDEIIQTLRTNSELE